MKDYIKIGSFESLHQAELQKEILNGNGIDAFIVNKRDYLFFIGYIELYVKKEDEKRSKQILEEFKGLTKVNSFVILKPILLFQKILQKDGINTKIKTKENDKYLMSNYELYVDNADAEKVLPYLSGEKLEGWERISAYSKVRQAQLHMELLDNNGIDTISIKKKDSDFHLLEVQVYAKNEDREKAQSILDALEGYKVLRSSENYTKLEVDEQTLADNSVPALLRKADSVFELLVKEGNYEEADRILLEREEWIKLKSFADMPQAVFYKHFLEQNSIYTVILNEKDSNFLIGDVELYVEESNFDKASELLKTI